MKTILILFTIICFTACKQTESKQDVENSKTDTLQTVKENINPEFDDNISNEIKNYYKTVFGKDARYEEKVTDSTYEITYSSIPKDSEDYDGFLIGIYLPKKNHTKSIIYGDLNNDNLQDLVVRVGTEGGGSGSSQMYWSDLFIFLNKNDKLIFTGITNSNNLCGCDDGDFNAEKIENGYLVGNSFCYTTDDARCCPSLHYQTKATLLKNKFVFNSKARIK